MPFGQVRNSIGSITQTDFGYTGQRNEAYTDLMDYKSRFYDGTLGKFVQPDSIVPSGVLGLNRYAAMVNNPIRYNDPTGHCVVLCTAIIGGAVGAMGGGIAYTIANNGQNFITTDFFTAVGAGAVAGTLIGSGIGLLAAPVAITGIAGFASAATINTTGTALIGGGAGAAGSGLSYIGSTAGNFDPDDFVVATSVGGVTGAVGAVTPITSGGVALKGITYIAGAEVQYGLTTQNWTTQGAIQAAQYGGIAAAFDVGISAPFQSLPGTSLSGVYPNGNPAQMTAVLRIAARQRYGAGIVNGFTGLVSGVGSGVVTHFVNRIEAK